MEKPPKKSSPLPTQEPETESSKRAFTLEDLDKWAKQVRQLKAAGLLREKPGSDVEVRPEE